jgi:regulatory protein
MAGQLRESERARAYAVWSKKFSDLPTTPAERAKQARFLASRGFSSAAITAVLKGGEWLEEAGGEFPED